MSIKADECPWKICAARYDKKLNAVRERRVKDFKTSQDGETYFQKYKDRPISLYHKDCIHNDNMHFTMIKTRAYHAEYAKWIDK